jgi:guanylate kinase
VSTGTGRTPRRSVREALAAGHDAILKIDVQGAQAVKERVPEALLIFVVPPSLEALFQRLKARATESADELEIRQRNAAIELARQDDYDYVVVNETGQVDRTALISTRSSRSSTNVTQPGASSSDDEGGPRTHRGGQVGA